MKKESKSMVIILGSGRSGTSLLMHILSSLGMGVSKNLIGPHYENQNGFFEDVEIVQINKKILRKLGASPLLPLPDGWINNPSIIPLLEEIKSHIVSSIEDTKGIWGIKDPRLSLLLPFWLIAIKSLWIVPRFVLSLRDASVVVRSLVKQANMTFEQAELVWLLRVSESLINTGFDCHIVHYEDWFLKPTDTAKSLMLHLGLCSNLDDDIHNSLNTIIKKNLNRSVVEDYKIKNPYVNKLNSALMDCRGSDFDREGLIAIVKDCRSVMDGFKGWCELAQDLNIKLAHVEVQLRHARAQADNVKILEERIRELENSIAANLSVRTQLAILDRQMNSLFDL